jgi:hypothetical protein
MQPRPWPPDGDPCRAWQAQNKLGVVTGLLEIQGMTNRKPAFSSTWHTVWELGRKHGEAGRVL